MKHEWLNEPNELTFEAEGLPCVMLRGPFGHWCGYVGIPQSHPWFGLSYNSRVADLALEVHGGITWSDNRLPTREDLAPPNHFWFGFDCAHSEDLAPNMLQYAKYGMPIGIYRNQSYVVAECQSLARQLAQLME